MEVTKAGMDIRKIIFTILVIVGIFGGLTDGLKCWECENDLNWEKCKLLNTKECTFPQTKCGKFYSKQGAVETYKRDCFTEEYCTKKLPCTSQFEKCEISCCSGDACNSAPYFATAPYLFTLMLLLSTLIIFLE